jgi:hypothetical protein
VHSLGQRWVLVECEGQLGDGMWGVVLQYEGEGS